MKRTSIILASLVIFSCNSEEPATQKPVAHTEPVSQAATPAPRARSIKPAYTTNSDGSQTHVSSLTVCDANAPKVIRKQPCNWQGSEINFYSAGENFTSVDPSSFNIEYFKIDGVDRMLNRSQEPNVTFGSFPDVEKDGKFLTWSIYVAQGLNSISNNIKYKGSVTAYKSSQLTVNESEPFNVYDYSGFTLGEIRIGGTKDKPNSTAANAPKGAMMQEVLASAMSGMFGGFSNSKDKEEISIAVFDHKALERVELYDGDKKLSSRGWWGSEGHKLYQFEKPSQENVTVKVFYWEDMQPVTLNIDF